MSKIDNIFIYIDSLTEQIHMSINLNNCIVNYNGCEFEVTKSSIDNLIDTIILWKQEYGSSDMLDSEKYEIKIDVDGSEYIMRSMGKHPANYLDFRNWVNKYARRTI